MKHLSSSCDRFRDSRSTATAPSAQPTYRLQNNGELWVSRADTCDGKPCVSWHLLDNDPTIREITAGVAKGPFNLLNAPPDGAPLYQRRVNGRIFRYTGTGWELLYDPTTLTIVSTQN